MTDKMLSRKDGGVGYLIFNNPERHTQFSMEMWAATCDILDQFRNDADVRVRRLAPGADISKFGSERASEDGIAQDDHQPSLLRPPRIPEANDRADDPRLLHRRRHGCREPL